MLFDDISLGFLLTCQLLLEHVFGKEIDIGTNPSCYEPNSFRNTVGSSPNSQIVVPTTDASAERHDFLWRSYGFQIHGT